MYRFFLSPHSLSVTTVTLGSHLFFILLQINLLQCSPTGDRTLVMSSYLCVMHFIDLGSCWKQTLCKHCEQHLHSSHIPSGCLSHLIRRDSDLEEPSSLHSFHEVVLSLKQVTHCFTSLPFPCQKNRCPSGGDRSRSIVVTILFHVAFCILCPVDIRSHLSDALVLLF